ncbi:MAG: SAM-dependent methyltransferase [Oligoflexia bacterium]|nr:SAM-dependent methyltransferase [Oligoflexia bacterium]
MKSRQSVKSNKVKSELLTEQSVELLKELHLLTPDGHLNADARRKLKQVNHLIQLIQPALNDILERHQNVHVVDVGAGKSYLGFILYDVFFKKNNLCEVTSIETREDLTKKAKVLSEKLGFKMNFLNLKVDEANLDKRVHLLTALHACDTATDDAITMGIKNNADYIALVPCCQAEVAEQLKRIKTADVINELWAQGIHRREFASHLTNVMRCLVLETFGYNVTVTELVGWEHSLKNEFIFAKRVNKENKQAKEKLLSLIEKIPIKPKVLLQLGL